MKKIVLLISIFSLFAFTSSDVKRTSVMITPNSKLLIVGKTNVNSFNCRYDILKLQKPIPVFYKKHHDKISFDNTVLVLDNVNFDCGGRGINADFHELLKTKTYPQIRIKLKEISEGKTNNKPVLAHMDITIAGITKGYQMPVEVSNADAMQINGILNLNLSDFNLEAPKKALGLIVVKDEIEINFELAVKKD